MTLAGDVAQPRALADRCPGLLRPHAAEDGLLVRLRVPGGQTSSSTLLELSRIAVDLGHGSLQLTSRGNLQLRGLPETRWSGLVERVAAAGLLPSITHERVRNIVASPLTGLAPQRPDLRSAVAAFDAALCDVPELAELPGRFLFAFDDGCGDVTSMRFDLAYLALGPEAGLVLVGDRQHGIAAPAASAVGLMIELAQAFLRVREGGTPRPWHVSELATVEALDARIAPVSVPSSAGSVPLGAVDGAASVGVPLSLLNPRIVAAIDRAACGGPVVVTPWRGVVVPGAAAALPELAEAGLVTEDQSAWSQLSACIGAPGCAKSRISTQQLAVDLADVLHTGPGLPVHVSGCDRRCGAPTGSYADLVAPSSLAAALAMIERAR